MPQTHHRKYNLRLRERHHHLVRQWHQLRGQHQGDCLRLARHRHSCCWQQLHLHGSHACHQLHLPCTSGLQCRLPRLQRMGLRQLHHRQPALPRSHQPEHYHRHQRHCHLRLDRPWYRNRMGHPCMEHR